MINLSNALMHHGIKGQKWGIRRYQNEDGTLTAEGRERYLRIIKDAKKLSYSPRGKLPSSVQITKDGYVISPNARMYRVATKNEPIDSKRKYVSITTQDRKRYKEYGKEGQLGVKDPELDLREYIYKSIDPIKIANGHSVTKYILQEFGDKEVQKANNFILDLYTLPDVADDDAYGHWYTSLNEDDKNFIIDLRNKASQAKNRVRWALNSALFNNDKGIADSVAQEFANRGYHGIVDVEDWYGGFLDMPIMIFNPQEKIKKVRSYKLK